MLPLEGTKVLDLSQRAPGPLCTMVLADFGAEVVKIEAPQEAGISRAWSDLNLPLRERVYNPLHRNKKSMTLNLRADPGKEIFYKLSQGADVILEGFRPGVAKRLGIDYESISKINPRIVYCSLSGYGQDGPYSDLPGHDINYISIAGALGMIGNSPDSPPAIPLNLVADFAGGSLHAVIGILLALMARGKIGRGQYVDIAMIDGVISLLGFSTYEYFCFGRIPQRGDDMLNGGFPCYNVYQTKDDGYISIGCVEAHFWENLCRALGREDFIPYQWSQDKEKQEEIFSFLRKTFLTKTRDEWFELLKNTVPTGKVYSMGEAFADPQVLHRKMMVEIDHSEAGKVKQIGIGIKLRETPGKIRSLAPSPGDHDEEILLSLGYTEQDIRSLRSKKVI